MNRQLLQLLKDNATRNEALPAITSELTPTEAHIYVYDVIDAWWGASAENLIAALADAGDRAVHLHINSPGGDVFEARAMSAALVAHNGPIVAHVDGIAASAATQLVMAASEARMLEGSLFMIHNSWTIAMGNKDDLLSTAALLEKIDSQINADYTRATGKTADEITALMNAETWFTPQEAMDAGFIDAIDSNSKKPGKCSTENRAGAERWNLSAYANAPKPKIKAEGPCGAECPSCGTACCGQSKCPSCGADTSSACTCEACGAGCCGYSSCPNCCAPACSSGDCVPCDTEDSTDATDNAAIATRIAQQVQLNRNRLRMMTPI